LAFYFPLLLRSFKPRAKKPAFLFFPCSSRQGATGGSAAGQRPGEQLPGAAPCFAPGATNTAFFPAHLEGWTSLKELFIYSFIFAAGGSRLILNSSVEWESTYCCTWGN